MKALVLLSGGQDSTTCLYWALREYGKENVSAFGFDYGQRHIEELKYAQAICDELGISFVIQSLPTVSEMTENALTRSDIQVDNSYDGSAPPNTLVEGRNLIFLTYAAIYAKKRGIKVLVTGVSQADYSGYPDCRDVFIKSTNVTLSLGLDYPFLIETPLMWRDKAQVWALARELGVLDIIKEKTLTCYNGVPGEGCGDCPACNLRSWGYEGFVRDEQRI
ncbi:MAG: 7-cyano-7-deazaguanine synthase QueC [Defluviitaleaceae bacterium]|nr:7-cyano-7-deazaguanine synthase QueC [Defluviitaleaceae bacterium]MCL2276155.1 7-cyano-7-deazaguanine synthase QueC [Defluviitaleaceae bacterium]